MDQEMSWPVALLRHSQLESHLRKVNPRLPLPILLTAHPLIMSQTFWIPCCPSCGSGTRRATNKKKAHALKRRDKQTNSSKTKRDNSTDPGSRFPQGENIVAFEQIFGNLVTYNTPLETPYSLSHFQLGNQMILWQVLVYGYQSLS